jgi:hypothetical protein
VSSTLNGQQPFGAERVAAQRLRDTFMNTFASGFG